MGAVSSLPPPTSWWLYAGRSGAVRLLLRLRMAGQDLGEFVGAGDDSRCVQPARLAGESLNGAGDRDRRDDATRGGPDRRRDRGDARLALADRLGPAAAAHTGERRGIERRTLESAVESVRLDRKSVV